MQANINEEHFMLQVKHGDLDSLIPLFETYHVKIYNFFLRFMRCEATAEDLTQNVFSRIIQYKDSYNEQKPFRAWIYQIARNVNHDHFKKRKEFNISDRDSNVPIENLEESKIDFDKDQRHQTLKEALELLNPDEREILELSRFQDLKYEEISQITGSSIGAVKVKVHRAVNKLRKIYFQIA